MANLLNFPIKKIKEGSAEIFVPKETKISKKLPVFYNPAMKFNRDITILLLKQFPGFHLCDPLAGTGIRAIRFAKELNYKSITANDISERAVALIRKNMKHNNVKFAVCNKDANLLLLESSGFDFIDLDVFGSPNFMLDSAIRKLSRGGILAVTATDLAALCGTSPKACKRKYWAFPKKSPAMHETGIRILIRKIQLVASQYDKALQPLFSFFRDHYFRIIFKCEKDKSLADKILIQHDMVDGAGPIWEGKLWDGKVAEKLRKTAEKDAYYNKQKALINFLGIIKDESKINTFGFFDIHWICKEYKTRNIPRKDKIIEKLIKSGYRASSTHFKGTGIRTNASLRVLLTILK